jgi:hypothetical protein
MCTAAQVFVHSDKGRETEYRKSAKQFGVKKADGRYYDHPLFNNRLQSRF